MPEQSIPIRAACLLNVRQPRVMLAWMHDDLMSS
jgi:hypothetical protein